MLNIDALRESTSRFSVMVAGHPWSNDTTRAEQSIVRSDGVSVTITTYCDPATGLVVEEERLVFPDSPAIEWVLRLRNEGESDTPLLSEILPLDMVIERPAASVTLPLRTQFTSAGHYIQQKSDFVLHYMRGGVATTEDYQPLQQPLGESGAATFDFGAGSGRSSDPYLPFFNLQYDDAAGMIVAVGWSGQWHAWFDMEQPHALRLRAGMETTSLVLHPGEEIRTPRIVLLPWEGDRIDSHNQWRRFIARYHTLPLRGEQPQPQTWTNTWFSFNQGFDVNEENQKESMTAASRMGVETLVVDAGWFECRERWWDGAGSWVPRDDTFPRGIRPLTEHGRREGIDFGLWFEPERVYEGTRLWHEHPEWLLTTPEWPEGPNRLLNIGLPEAQEWFIDLVGGYVEQGMRWFRHDYNINPLPFWRGADAADRQGMTEIRYNEGLYRIYDEIHRRYPDILIEGCSSGGRRMDLETASRNHGYWATDMMCGTPEPMQAHIWGFNQYLLPHLHNTCLQTSNMPLADTPDNRYRFFSFLGGAPVICFDTRAPEVNLALGKQWLDLFKQIRHFTLGDYYPLTDYSLSLDTWAASQFYRPDLNEGIVAVFRRPESPYSTAEFHLRGLQPETTYQITELFTAGKLTLTGRELMESFEISLPQRPDVAIYRYHRC
ncbi:MAG: alpha-galactosidase [Armatimonadota bacterium]